MIWIIEVRKLSFEQYLFHFSFVLKDHTKLLDTFLNVKNFHLFYESIFVFVEKSVIKNIVDIEVYEFGSLSYSSSTVGEPTVYRAKLNYVLIFKVHLFLPRFQQFDDLLECYKKGFHGSNLSNQWMKRVSELMWDSCTNYLWKVLFFFHVVVKNLVWIINYLYKDFVLLLTIVIVQWFDIVYQDLDVWEFCVWSFWFHFLCAKDFIL